MATKVFRVVKSLQRVRSVILVLYCSFRQYLWYFLFQSIITVVFAQIGTDLFYGVRFGKELTSISNFNSFTGAVAILFQVATGDWVQILEDCSVEYPKCTQGLDCGNRTLSTIYFFCFYFSMYMIIMKMLIGLVIENYTWVHSLADSESEADALLNLTLKLPLTLILTLTPTLSESEADALSHHISTLTPTPTPTLTPTLNLI